MYHVTINFSCSQLLGMAMFKFFSGLLKTEQTVSVPIMILPRLLSTNTFFHSHLPFAQTLKSLVKRLKLLKYVNQRNSWSYVDM